MGGGHVSRPDFGMAQPDPAHPLTEFYLLVQQALDKAGCFALPALYASLQAPARRIYPEEAREYLRLAPQAGESFVHLQAAVQMQVLYSSLQVAADGAPAALLLTEECTRSVTALQLLPPFVWEDPLPPLPDVCFWRMGSPLRIFSPIMTAQCWSMMRSGRCMCWGGGHRTSISRWCAVKLQRLG